MSSTIGQQAEQQAGPDRVAPAGRTSTSIGGSASSSSSTSSSAYSAGKATLYSVPSLSSPVTTLSRSLIVGGGDLAVGERRRGTRRGRAPRARSPGASNCDPTNSTATPSERGTPTAARGKRFTVRARLPVGAPIGAGGDPQAPRSARRPRRRRRTGGCGSARRRRARSRPRTPAGSRSRRSAGPRRVFWLPSRTSRAQTSRLAGSRAARFVRR